MKILYAASMFVLLTLTAFSQKLITTINTSNRVEGYSFRYDRPSGSWIYQDYDTTAKKSVIITPNGKSGQYDLAMYYYSVFDEAGNVYSAVYNAVTDTTFVYYLVKNGDEVATFDYIGEGWAYSNGVVYFYAKENGRAFIAAYNTSSGSISKGKGYDDIYLVSYPEGYYEDEPVGSIGFTKSGEPYYIASDKGEKFLVTGTMEHKHYADIDYYLMRTDNNGEPVYIAKSKGQFYVDKGNTFVVQGTKEYKEFDYIYGPVIFDKENNPVYTASDSTGEYKYRTRLMRGSNEGKAYDGNIYEFKLTPSGKTAFVVSGSKTDPSSGDEIFESFTVINGKEGKHYSSVNSLKFDGHDVPYYTASDSKNKYFIVRNESTASKKYDYINDYSFDDNGITSYVGTLYGNYDLQKPDKNFVHIADKRYGPYEFISMADYSTGNYVLDDGKGNFAFITGRLVNKEEYYYKYKIISNDFESDEYDLVDQLKMYKGKCIYVSGTMLDKASYTYKYNLNIEGKTVAENYDSLMDLTIDSKSGKLTVIGCKGSSFYLVEIEI